MNYNEFINNYNGKSFDYDGVSGVQCVDLIKMYLDKVFGIKAGAWGNAKDYYENFNNLPLKNSFTRIANTTSFIPQLGDIVVWGAGLGNTYGHIAIATGEGNTTNFYSYDLNWGSKTVHKVNHNYKGFLGVLRAKDQSKITGVVEKIPDLQYEVHIEDRGWCGWQNAGEGAGSEGKAKRLEAVKFRGNNGLTIEYQAHVQDIGWQDWKKDGEVAGTTGKSLRLEALRIKCNKMLEVEEHIENIGWTPKFKSKEFMIGTEGRQLRLEAFRINVVG